MSTSLLRRTVRWCVDHLPSSVFWKTPARSHRIPDDPLISLFIVTYNRRDMLERSLSALFPTLSGHRWELIVWNNASTDGTNELLKKYQHRIGVRIIDHPANIGVNAKSQAAALCTGDVLVGIDDDVIDFAPDWLARMLNAFRIIPSLGYLASDVVQDERTNGAKWPKEFYRRECFENDAVTLLAGPTGGWCYMIPRWVYDELGPLLQVPDRKFFLEDADYIGRCINAGFRFGILEGVKNYHACGIVTNEKHRAAKQADIDAGDGEAVRRKQHRANITSVRRYLYKLRESALGVGPGTDIHADKHLRNS